MTGIVQVSWCPTIKKTQCKKKAWNDSGKCLVWFSSERIILMLKKLSFLLFGCAWKSNCLNNSYLQGVFVQSSLHILNYLMGWCHFVIYVFFTIPNNLFLFSFPATEAPMEAEEESPLPKAAGLPTFTDDLGSQCNSLNNSHKPLSVCSNSCNIRPIHSQPGAVYQQPRVYSSSNNSNSLNCNSYSYNNSNKCWTDRVVICNKVLAQMGSPRPPCPCLWAGCQCSSNNNFQYKPSGQFNRFR